MDSYFVHHSSCIDDDVVIGEGTRIWHYSHLQKGARIGKECTIGQNVNIGNHVTIGNGVKIQNNVSVYEGVTIEDDVFCGPSCVFTNDLMPRAFGDWELKKTLIKKGASIGANATIVCGNCIGRYALIGAGSVVVSDVPDYALMVGVPARQIGWVCECGRKLDNSMYCSKCETEYTTINSRQIKKIEKMG